MSNSKNRNAEHNLIFAGLGLQLGIIAKDKVIRAFTEWLFDKARPLGEILVHQKAITPEQWKTLESVVEAHIQQEGGEQKALASLKNARALEDELNHLEDEDINNTILPAITSQKGIPGIPQPLPTSPPTPKVDSQGTIDRFERGAFLDAGNLGEIYFAKDKELNRTVVTKYIKPEIANEQTHQALFHLEGEVTGALEHPSIVPVYGLNKDSKGRLYYAMRYIPGRRLTRVIQEYHRISHSEKESKREAFISLLQNFHAACLAIEYAHIKGVLHCDIKPDNIMVGDFGEVFVVDWGLAVVQSKKIETQSPDPQMTIDEGQIPTFRPSESAARGLHINQGGSRYGVGGTPAYMAPEQLQATKLNNILLIDSPSDIYGLGATLYHITTGKAPHLPIKQPRESLDDFHGRIMDGKFPKPNEMNKSVPHLLSAIVMKAMALNPQDRYTSARDLAEDIKWFMANNPVTAYETPLHEEQKLEAVVNELVFTYESQEISLPLRKLINKNAKDLPMDCAYDGNLIPRKAGVIYSINPDPLMDNAVQGSRLLMDRSVDDNLKSNNASLKAYNFICYGLVLIIIFIAWGVYGGSGWKLTGERFVGIIIAILFLGVCFKFWKNHLKAKLVDQGKDESVVMPDIDDLSPKFTFETPKINNLKISDNKIVIEMALVPAGKFKMGSPVSEKGRSDGETQHEVLLTKPFYMGKYAVTQEQWESVMGNNPSSIKGTKLPVTDINWHDCQEFVQQLNAKIGGGYRLPTEAEWEYACRAGASTAYSFGAKIRLKDSNYADLKIGKPLPVGSFKPNNFGLYDMHGNVWEWCEDWFGYYPSEAVTDPKGPAIGKARVLRGGSFKDKGLEVRSSSRMNNSQFSRSCNYGFRLARTDPETKAREAQKEIAKRLGREVEEKAYLGKAVNLDMVLIPAGEFLMGSSAYENGRSNNETQHAVTLTKPYYIGKYEVMQEQWEVVMGNNPSQIKGDKLPVTNVSWEDTQEFIKKLNTKTDGGYRLLTEAEWEYACRAGTTTAYSFGNTIVPKDANYNDSNIGKPVAVGSYKPNGFGLYDMHGNVWEWCEDWYGDYPSDSVTDPMGAIIGKHRVLRGGSFGDLLTSARSSYRDCYSPTNRNDFSSFRLARTI